MQVADWLRGLALEQYAPAFEQNHIRWELLAELTADDLKDLGVASVGHRRQLLAAIAALRAKAGAEPEIPRDSLATTPEAERRQVTVMFCDLVGSTALSARLDPEDLRELLSTFQRCVVDTVARFQGLVARFMGDGALIYFGYPHAHEDDAEQAVRAGLTLIDAVGELQAPQRLQVRVGIATGVVVVGDLIGSGSAQEQAIVGDTPNLAARLQALAEPDAVVIAESTRRQIGARFKVCDLGPQSLKGFTEPQRVWRVLAENRTLGRFEALRSGATPLIGRDEEVELLLRRWAQAKAGSGRVVLISGEPGVGKSRLAEAIEEKISGEPHIRLRYFCSPHHENSAFHPIIVHTEHAAGFAREDAPRKKLAKLQELLAATALPPENVALIAELHALPSTDVAAPLDVSPQRKKEKTFEALLRQLEGLSRQQPVLMVFEDIHWIDPSSQELLDRTIERIANWPVLLLATFRPEFQAPWTGQSHVTTLALTRLNRHDTAAMVTNMAGNALSSETVQEIAERTDGVPLFVEELTSAVLEAGAQGGAALSSVPHQALSVPATLHASLIARLDRLGPAAKDVAQICAAIGREFGYEVLAFVAELPETRLREALDRLTNSGLLFVRGSPPQSTYIFKHVLVQEAAYGTLLRTRRQQLHTRIVTTLEDHFPEIVATQPAWLAQHCSEAGLLEKGVGYRLKAGQQAIARSAMMEAVAQLRKGLEALSGFPEGPRRHQQELDLQVALRGALSVTKGFSTSDVGDTLVRARELAEQLDRPEYLVFLMAGQWEFHTGRCEHRLALQLAEQIEKIGEARSDATARLVGRGCIGLSRCYLGEFVAARTFLEWYLGQPALLAAARFPLLNPYAIMPTRLALVLTYLGYIDQARLLLNEGLSEARRRRHAYTLIEVLSRAVHIDELIRSPELRQHIEEVLALATEHGFSFYLGGALVCRGKSLTALGNVDEGLALLKEGLAAVRATEPVGRACRWRSPKPTPFAGNQLQVYVASPRPRRPLRSPSSGLMRLSCIGPRRLAESHRRSIRSRAELSPVLGRRAAPKRKALRMAFSNQPRPALARPRQARRSPRSTRTHL